MSKLKPIINSNITQQEFKTDKINIDINNIEPEIKVKEKELVQIFNMGGQGPMGPMGPAGPTGNGIIRIEKTSTSDVIDTYTIFFTNGDTFEYQITNAKIYYYEGPYEVTPMVDTIQILPTSNLVMSEDVSINEIPYYEVSNLSGGKTVTIGVI